MTDNETLKFASFLEKGGVGKTTSTAHIARALADLDQDVLAIDLAGKQGDLTKLFGCWESYEKEIESEDGAWPNISTVFDDAWGVIAKKFGNGTAVKNLIMDTGEGVDIIPAHPALDDLDDDLGNIDNARKRYSKLEGFFTEFVDPLGYDVVLVDLPGASNNVTFNGLWACKNVLVPVEGGRFEREQADQLEHDLTRLDENFGVDVSIALVLPNKTDKRRNIDVEYLEEFRSSFEAAIAPQPVPFSTNIRDATDEGRTAFTIKEPSVTGERARSAYRAAAEQLLERGGA